MQERTSAHRVDNHLKKHYLSTGTKLTKTTNCYSLLLEKNPERTDLIINYNVNNYCLCITLLQDAKIRPLSVILAKGSKSNERNDLLRTVYLLQTK